MKTKLPNTNSNKPANTHQNLHRIILTNRLLISVNFR